MENIFLDQLELTQAIRSHNNVVNIYKIINNESRRQIDEINQQIKELQERKLQLEMIISNNVRNITLLDGYECILSSTDMAASDGERSLDDTHLEDDKEIS